MVIESTFLQFDGETCDRCTDTQSAVREAVEALQPALAAREIPVTLVEHDVTVDELADSNTVLINGRPLEEWLGAERVSTDCPSCGDLVGESVCCSALSVGGEVHESLTVDHVMTASLTALGLMKPSGGCC